MNTSGGVPSGKVIGDWYLPSEINSFTQELRSLGVIDPPRIFSKTHATKGRRVQCFETLLQDKQLVDYERLLHCITLLPQH